MITIVLNSSATVGMNFPKTPFVAAVLRTLKRNKYLGKTTIKLESLIAVWASVYGLKTARAQLAV